MDLLALKVKTESLLREKGIEINPELPTIEGLDEVVPVSAKDVASRVCAMAYVVGMAFGANRGELITDLKRYGLWHAITYKEKRMLEADAISKEEERSFSWMTENIQALAWSLGLVSFSHDESCDEDLASKIPFQVAPKKFIDSATLRQIEEIQAQSDLLYRMHWYAVHTRLNSKECPYNERVIYERRKAIDWVYGVEKDWDDVPMDT